MKGRPHGVLIVDDSRTIRSLLRVTIDVDPRLEVVGEASDPHEAREKIKALNPDVLTLDVEMPRMNGLDFLRNLMRLRPMPVVMVSTRTRENSEDAIRALSIGAVDCVDAARLHGDPAQRSRLADMLVLAAKAAVRSRAPELSLGKGLPRNLPIRWNGKVVLVGSSTGGVEAIERMLEVFPANGPPTLIAQHMPEAFLRSFAARLDQIVEPVVRIADDGDEIRQGEVLIAPGGGWHMAISRSVANQVRLVRGDADDLYVPSVDRLFASARPVARRCVAAMLTGMGSDGATPMAELRAGGARTLAQRGDTCVVDGMPKAARLAGAVDESPPLGEIGKRILALCSREETE